MRSFESIREEIIEEEERLNDLNNELADAKNKLYLYSHEIAIDKIYYMNGYEAWKVVQQGNCEGSDGCLRYYVTMIRLSDNNLRTVLELSLIHIWRCRRRG